MPKMIISDGASGGTFDPLSATTFTFNGLDVDHLGHLGTVTDLKVQDGWFMHDSDDASFDATLSTLEVLADGVFSQMDLGTVSIPTVTVRTDGKVTHEANLANQEDHKLILSATTLTLDGGKIDIDGQGYRCNTSGNGEGYGPGAGSAGGDTGYFSNGGGGGHGGQGGPGTTYAAGTANGSITAPVNLGSGGADNINYQSWQCGHGGGAARIIVSGTFSNNGEVTADSTNASLGGAGSAGGSIWIDANTITGTGTLTANGGVGADNGGSGGGGRIAVEYITDSSSNWSYEAHSALGGGGTYQTLQGAAGTIWLSQNGANGDLIVENANLTNPQYTEVTGTATFDNISVDSGALLRFPSGSDVSVNTGGIIDGEGTDDGTLRVVSGATLDPQSTTLRTTGLDVYLEGTLEGVDTLEVDDANFYFESTGDLDGGIEYLDLNAGAVFTNSSSNALFSGSTLDVGSGATYVHDSNDVLGVDTVIVRTNGTITHGDNSTSKDAQVYISATDMTIETDGRIDVDGFGYDQDEGPGAGTQRGGGGHGGPGEDDPSFPGGGGGTYGSETAPVTMGSGGDTDVDGGEGGGVIRLVVSGTLTNNGVISADGTYAPTGFSGGGAGGSIWIDAGTMTCAGGGVITADGGPGNISGGDGGGGRIAIFYTSYAGCSPQANSPAGVSYYGTVYESQNAPTITSLTVTPSDPTVNDTLVAETDATYGSGIDSVDLYVDGSPPATGLVHTCTYTGSPTSVECDYEIGKLSRGDHTV
ncbi:hypothetical protein ACFL26_02495, partial [Patescibacteria group bacterium]